jgi:hypothetical protein
MDPVTFETFTHVGAAAKFVRNLNPDSYQIFHIVDREKQYKTVDSYTIIMLVNNKVSGTALFSLNVDK